MGDNHVCSFCNENQQGKQHIKIVFENWPVEEEVIYRRKGKEARKTRKVTKEVITAIGMECIGNADRWKDFDIDPGKVADFFEDLRFVGKNPFFRAILTKDGPVCLCQAKCPHFSPMGEVIPLADMCRHISSSQFELHHLNMLYCQVGHQGIELVRQPSKELLLQGNVKSWVAALKQLWQFSGTNHRFLSGYYFFWLFFGWFVPYVIVWAASFPMIGIFLLGQRLKWKVLKERTFALQPPPKLF